MIYVSESELAEMSRHCDFCRRKARSAVTLNSDILFCVCVDHRQSLLKKFKKKQDDGIWTLEAEPIESFLTVAG